MSLIRRLKLIHLSFSVLNLTKMIMYCKSSFKKNDPVFLENTRKKHGPGEAKHKTLQALII